MDSVLVWLEDEPQGYDSGKGRALEVSSELAASGSIAWLEPEPMICDWLVVLDVCAAGMPAALPAPRRPTLYRRTYPRRYQTVVAETVTIKKHEPISGAGASRINFVDALVYEKVG